MAELSGFPITKRWLAADPDIIQLYSLPTPNGVKVSIMLEETGLAYEPHLVDIGTGILIHDPVAIGQPAFQHAKQALRLGCVTVAWALVLIGRTGEFVEKAELPEHWADRRHLEHYPLDGFVAPGRIV